MDPSIAIDIISDDEDDDNHVQSFSQVASPTVLVIDDDPTPQKPNSKNPNRVPSSFAAETLFSDDVSIVKCSFTSDRDNCLSNKFAGIPSFICLESDNDSEDAVHNSNSPRPGSDLASFELVGSSERNSTFASQSEEDMCKLNYPIKPTAANDGENSKKAALNLTIESSNGGNGTVGSLRRLEDDPSNDNMDAELLPQIRNVLDRLRRGERLRIEDIVTLDRPLFHGMADMHDRHRDMRLDVDNMSYEELLALQERIGNVSTGLSEDKIIRLLKQQKYVHIEKDAAVETETCCICQGEYVEGEELGTLDCTHDFHVVCIKQWLMQKNICPVCKTTALIT